MEHSASEVPEGAQSRQDSGQEALEEGRGRCLHFGAVRRGSDCGTAARDQVGVLVRRAHVEGHSTVHLGEEWDVPGCYSTRRLDEESVALEA